MEPPQRDRPRRGWSSTSTRTRAWSAVAVLVLVVAAGSVLAVSLDRTQVVRDNQQLSVPDEPTWADASEPSALGDRVTAHVTAITADGRPISSTDYSAAVLLNLTFGMELRDATQYEPASFVLGSGDIGLLGPLVEAYLYNVSVGDRLQTEVIAAEDTVTGPDGDPFHMDRRFGPFPMVESVPVEKFESRFPNATTGDVVQLNPRFYAQVESMDGAEVTYRYLVRDGDTVPMPVLGPTGTLTIEVEGDVFYDVADVEKGSTFNRRNDRVLNMTHGPYIVQDVTNDEIILQRLKAPLYDFAFQDVFFVFDVVSVEQAVAG